MQMINGKCQNNPKYWKNKLHLKPEQLTIHSTLEMLHECTVTRIKFDYSKCTLLVNFKESATMGQVQQSRTEEKNQVWVITHSKSWWKKR
jgi:hypothetical protein